MDLIGPDNVKVPEVQNTAGALVGMLTESPLMEYWLPKLLARVDPHGLEMPRRLAALIGVAVDAKQVATLSRAGCHYKVGTPAWRHIARAAFKASQSFPPEERADVYYTVSETGRRSWVGEAGKMAKVFTDAVEAAKRGLAEETERDFLPFWQWRLQCAEQELRDQEATLKEKVWD